MKLCTNHYENRDQRGNTHHRTHRTKKFAGGNGHGTVAKQPRWRRVLTEVLQNLEYSAGTINRIANRLQVGKLGNLSASLAQAGRIKQALDTHFFEVNVGQRDAHTPGLVKVNISRYSRNRRKHRQERPSSERASLAA